MDTDARSAKRSILVEGELTEKILGAAMKLHNVLGCGFLEGVYENALATEMKNCGLAAEQQKSFPVRYEGVVIGDYAADLIVEGRVVVECKAVNNLEPAHEAQLLNYLKASGLRVGLLLNFARPKLQYRRMVL
jgi:GxxExxY protein